MGSVGGGGGGGGGVSWKLEGRPTIGGGDVISKKESSS